MLACLTEKCTQDLHHQLASYDTQCGLYRVDAVAGLALKRVVIDRLLQLLILGWWCRWQAYALG